MRAAPHPLQSLKTDAIQKRVEHYAALFAGKRLLIGVDRLDYIKGVPHKLHAFDLFLSQHPEFQENTVLIQIAVPTRTDVEEYKNLRTTVNELVGRINSKYGRIEYTPLQFLYRSIGFQDLVALYRIADVCVVSSTRDGMNLVAYEYIATQVGRNGVLILSEFAGAAQSLNGAIIVNPWNTEELADAYYDALMLNEETRLGNHQKLFRYVTKYTAAFWGQSFVADLRKASASVAVSKAASNRLSVSGLKTIFAETHTSKVILLNYDGVLNMTPSITELTRPSVRVVEILTRLAEMPDTFVYVMSGRDREHLEEWFGPSRIGLIAEHGCFYRHPESLGLGDEWCVVAGFEDDSWKGMIRPLIRFYCERTPGSFLEEKEVRRRRRPLILSAYGRGTLERPTRSLLGGRRRSCRRVWRSC